MLVRVPIIRSAEVEDEGERCEMSQITSVRIPISGPRVRTDFQVGLGLAVCLGHDRTWRRALAGLRFGACVFG
jgi:hypothetical protein